MPRLTNPKIFKRSGPGEGTKTSAPDFDDHLPEYRHDPLPDETGRTD